MLRFLILVCFSFALCSCEDVVQVKLEEGSKLYVIDAFLTDLPEADVVKVNYSDPYFSNSEPKPVAGVQVSIKDLNTLQEVSFTDAGNGEHVLGSVDKANLLVTGHQYQLNVHIAGTTYTALATKKRTAVIRRIDTTYVPAQSVFGQTLAPYYSCSLVAKDTVDDNADYYWIKTFRNDTLLFGPLEINFSFSIDGTNGPVSGIGADTTNFTPPGTFLGFKQYQRGDRCKVQIHSITRECYLFFVQAGQQVNNAGLFATTPENVRTNIVTPQGTTKAVGWFNVASVAEKEIQIQ